MDPTVTISIEIELGWGWHDFVSGPGVILSEDRQAETKALNWLLSLCDRFDIPISFNIVGHLLLEECEAEHFGPHSNDWFDRDPGTDIKSDPWYYAPDLVQRIYSSDTDHEIATHSFSHILCDRVDSEVLDWELDRVHEVHRVIGLNRPTSFVPPRNLSPPNDVLHRQGITAVRVAQPSPRRSKINQGARRFLKWIWNRGHPVFQPVIKNGIVREYSTPYPSLTAVHLPNGNMAVPAPFRLIPRRIRQRIQQRYLISGISKAVERKQNAHYWTHLSNLADNSQWPPIDSFLRKLSKARRTTDLQILTMRELSEMIRAG